MKKEYKETRSPITVKGIFIIPTIEDLKKKATEAELKRLAEVIPSLKLSPFKSYPIEYQLESEKILCRIIYGDYDYEAYVKFGKRSFNNFVSSNIGKVMISLFGKDPHKMIQNIQRLYNTVTSGIKIETKRLAEKKYSVRFFNDPYDLGGTEGVLLGGLEFMNLNKGKLEFINHGEKDHEFILSWE